ncbi:MAG TPA: endonuclease III domain-containing protein [Candidatus Desulfofervidus auxilii]|uniref:Endonuclease III domain-containing protein n=1 Tax=Desulfofervidus auxilii TaxID=1621989 RepID=A0A7V0NE79_DESA2|nr:endonuclease III domain-containing protein [Candidatus Desulfofervidus auxilii]
MKVQYDISSSNFIGKKLIEIFYILYNTFGPQYWWPGETPFEIIVGAILTQNTAWKNVEKAIDNLKRANVLTPQAIFSLPYSYLLELIRPAGFFNIKAKRLKNFLKFLFEEYGGNLKKMFEEDTELLREKLLKIPGIGPETADSILLYAGQKPTFVVDAYTKRVLFRHNLVSEESDYEEIRKLFLEHLPQDEKLFNEYHALFVTVGKNYCRPKPKCEKCPLKGFE